MVTARLVVSLKPNEENVLDYRELLNDKYPQLPGLDASELDSTDEAENSDAEGSVSSREEIELANPVASKKTKKKKKKDILSNALRREQIIQQGGMESDSSSSSRGGKDYYDVNDDFIDDTEIYDAIEKGKQGRDLDTGFCVNHGAISDKKKKKGPSTTAEATKVTKKRKRDKDASAKPKKVKATKPPAKTSAEKEKKSTSSMGAAATGTTEIHRPPVKSQKKKLNLLPSQPSSTSVAQPPTPTPTTPANVPTNLTPSQTEGEGKFAATGESTKPLQTPSPVPQVNASVKPAPAAHEGTLEDYLDEIRGLKASIPTRARKMPNDYDEILLKICLKFGRAKKIVDVTSDVVGYGAQTVKARFDTLMAPKDVEKLREGLAALARPYASVLGPGNDWNSTSMVFFQVSDLCRKIERKQKLVDTGFLGKPAATPNVARNEFEKISKKAVEIIKSERGGVDPWITLSMLITRFDDYVKVATAKPKPKPLTQSASNEDGGSLPAPPTTSQMAGEQDLTSDIPAAQPITPRDGDVGDVDMPAIGGQ